MQGKRHEETDSEDEWTDNEEDAAPLDDIDPFMLFADTLHNMQAHMPHRFQVPPLHPGCTCSQSKCQRPNRTHACTG